METRIITSSAPVDTALDARRWLMLIAILGATLMAAIDIFIVNVAIPSIENDLHTGFAQVQLVVAGYTLAYAVLLVVGGRLGDLYGRKRFFLLGVGGFTLCSALCGLAPNAFLLIIFRIVQGAEAAMMIPQVISFIQLSFVSRERPAAMSAYVATLGLASILGLVLGGGLIALNVLGTGWRSIFLINVPIGLVVLVMAGFLVRESKETTTKGLDYMGVVFLTLTLVLFIFPLVMGGNSGWPLWASVGLVLSVPCGVVFWLYELRVAKQGKATLVAPALFYQREFTVGNLVNLLNGALWNGMLFLFSIYLQTILRFPPLQAGLMTVVGSVAFILASATSTTLTRRLGSRNLTIAAGIVALGFLLIALTAQFLVERWGIVPLLAALFVIAFGQALLFTPLMRRTLEKVTPELVGAASGVFTTIGQTSAAVGVAVVGMIYAVLMSSGELPLDAFVLAMLLMAACSVGTIFLVGLIEVRRRDASRSEA